MAATAPVLALLCPILPSNLWEVQFCKAATIVLQSRADHWLRKGVCFSGCMRHKCAVTHHLSTETSQRKGGAMAPVIGIDVGTFTDAFATDGSGRVTGKKTPSIPPELSRASAPHSMSWR